jgi:hypothetical protein
MWHGTKEDWKARTMGWTALQEKQRHKGAVAAEKTNRRSRHRMLLPLRVKEIGRQQQLDDRLRLKLEGWQWWRGVVVALFVVEVLTN